MKVKVKNLEKKYGKKKVLSSISFSLNKGEIVGLLGPNGAGKTTLMKILSGYTTEWKGEIFFDNWNFKKNKINIQKKTGYLPENNPLYLDMYVKEYLFFIAEIYGVKKNIDNLIEQLGLDTCKNQKNEKLSKGYKQRVGLAAALIHNPNFLILDEPTTGLDPNQIVEIRNLIKNLGKDKIILFSTHILQEVEAICDRIIILNEGKISKDLSLNSLEKNENLDTIFRNLTQFSNYIKKN